MKHVTSGQNETVSFCPIDDGAKWNYTSVCYMFAIYLSILLFILFHYVEQWTIIWLDGLDRETFLKWLSHFQEHVNSCYPRQQSHDDSRQPCVSQKSAWSKTNGTAVGADHRFTVKEILVWQAYERLLLKEIAKENRKKKRSNKLEHVGEKSKKSKSVLTTNKQEEIAKRDKNNEFSEMTSESTLQRTSQNGLRMSRW